jgi:mRNA interferase MazF
MFEKFTNWIQLKFSIHNQEKNPFFKEREIWWCQFGQNIGDEENGKGDNFMRPVIIIRKYNQNLALVLPTSTKIKDNQYYYKINYKNKDYSALLSHARTIDTKRLKSKIADLPTKHFKELQIAFVENILRQKIDPYF